MVQRAQPQDVVGKACSQRHASLLTTRCISCPRPLQPWRLEVLRELRIAPGSAKIRASLRPGVTCHLPELLLAGSEDRRGGAASGLSAAVVLPSRPPACAIGCRSASCPSTFSRNLPSTHLWLPVCLQSFCWT